MLCTILGHVPITVFEPRERRHGHKTYIGGWRARKGGKPGTIIESMGTYYECKRCGKKLSNWTNVNKQHYAH